MPGWGWGLGCNAALPDCGCLVLVGAAGWTSVRAHAAQHGWGCRSAPLLRLAGPHANGYSCHCQPLTKPSTACTWPAAYEQGQGQVLHARSAVAWPDAACDCRITTTYGHVLLNLCCTVRTSGAPKAFNMGTYEYTGGKCMIGSMTSRTASTQRASIQPSSSQWAGGGSRAFARDVRSNAHHPLPPIAICCLKSPGCTKYTTHTAIARHAFQAPRRRRRTENKALQHRPTGSPLPVQERRQALHACAGTQASPCRRHAMHTLLALSALHVTGQPPHYFLRRLRVQPAAAVAAAVAEQQALPPPPCCGALPPGPPAGPPPHRTAAPAPRAPPPAA